MPAWNGPILPATLYNRLFACCSFKARSGYHRQSLKHDRRTKPGLGVPKATSRKPLDSNKHPTFLCLRLRLRLCLSLPLARLTRRTTHPKLTNPRTHEPPLLPTTAALLPTRSPPSWTCATISSASPPRAGGLPAYRDGMFSSAHREATPGVMRPRPPDTAPLLRARPCPHDSRTLLAGATAGMATEKKPTEGLVADMPMARLRTSRSPGADRCGSGSPRSRTRRCSRSTSLVICECAGLLEPRVRSWS